MRKHVYIIAEAGVNHNGDLNLAKKLIDVAVEAGVDTIKFQTFKAENIITKDAKKAAYQLKNSANNETQFEMLKRLELDANSHIELINYCKKSNITFLSTPFDDESIDFLHQLGLEIFKIPSGEINNLPYLSKIGSFKKKIILSTGMSNLSDIKCALDILTTAGTAKKNITVLHANTEYPTPFEDVNLHAMLTIAKEFDVSVGYSDHTLGIEVAIAAVAMGASVIEKHFTLDKTMPGPDHKASLEPQELIQLVKAIRNIELALGDGEKRISKSEEKNILVARKSIVAKTAIKKGEVFSIDNITVKRPGIGLSPMGWNEVIGKKATRDFKEDELIEL